MKRTVQQLAFVLTGTIFRPLVVILLVVLGSCGLIRTIFLVYPSDEEETRGFCPDIGLLRRFFSGRPTLGGFMFQGLRPRGIYVVIPDIVPTLAKRRNREIVHHIVRRLTRLARITRAHSIGMAGQLGFVFEKRHQVSMDPPLYGSLLGSLFSLTETIRKVVADREGLAIGILGQGEIGQALSGYLDGSELIELRFLRGGRLALRNEDEVAPRLANLDILVNMTPTGEDFLRTGCHEHLSPECHIVDFSHPGIAAELPQQITLGNRIRRRGLRFVKSLPGEWRACEIPACSLASLLARPSAPVPTELDPFFGLARERGYSVSD